MERLRPDQYQKERQLTADDVRIAGELGALLDKEFFAQDLPKFSPNAETASELISEAV